MGLSVPSIILILVIVILLFGTSKLKNMGSDLGSALKGFKKAVSEDDSKKDDQQDADFAPLEKPDQKTADSNVQQTSQTADKEKQDK